MITIAIDGHSSTGKSTMAKHLARQLGYRYIDSGAMYRAVTYYALSHKMIDSKGVVDSEALIASLPLIKIDFVAMPDGTQHTMLNGEDVENVIREMAVSSNVSVVASLPPIREEMVRQQRLLGKDGGVVMDGRDIGTTVFPHAELKLFVTAKDVVRADRRYRELRQKGDTDITMEEVLANVLKRDYIDEHRDVSPLQQASDAVLLDNSNLTQQEQSDMVYALAVARIKGL